MRKALSSFFVAAVIVSCVAIFFLPSRPAMLREQEYRYLCDFSACYNQILFRGNEAERACRLRGTASQHPFPECCLSQRNTLPARLFPSETQSRTSALFSTKGNRERIIRRMEKLSPPPEQFTQLYNSLLQMYACYQELLALQDSSETASPAYHRSLRAACKKFRIYSDKTAYGLRQVYGIPEKIEPRIPSGAQSSYFPSFPLIASA